MSRIKSLLRFRWQIALGILMAAYAGYFSWMSLARYYDLGARHLDLGVLHQAAYNTYRGILTGDVSRIMEVTKEYESPQINFLGWHNDVLHGLLSLTYLIHPGPQNFLILQSLALALGAWAVFKIVQLLFADASRRDAIAFVFAAAYLLYPPLERTNLFDYHSFVLVTPLILFMVYCALTRRYVWAAGLFAAALLTRENVGLTTALLGGYFIWKAGKTGDRPLFKFGLGVAAASVVWFLLSMYVIIPYFRGGGHFALDFYGDFGATPLGVVAGVFTKPATVFSYLARPDTLQYFLSVLGPLGFLSLYSSVHLLIASPEFGLDLLSNQWYMRETLWHYTALVQPFVILAAIYGAKKIFDRVRRTRSERLAAGLIIGWVLFSSLSFAYLEGPTVFGREYRTPIFSTYPEAYPEALVWSEKLKDENIKVSASSNLALLFSGRKYFYVFFNNYRQADYVIVNPHEFINDQLFTQVYGTLTKDSEFVLISKSVNLEVYKKKTADR